MSLLTLFGLTSFGQQYSAGLDANVCVSHYSMQAQNAYPYMGTWVVVSVGGTPDSIHSPSSMVFNLSPGANVFIWSIDSVPVSEWDTVIIYNNSITANAGPDLSIETDMVTLQAAPLAAGEWGMWSVVSGGGNVFDTIPNAVVRNIPLGDNIYRWTIHKSGCVSSDDVLVHRSAVTQYSAGPDANVCEPYYQMAAQGTDNFMGT